MSHLQVWHQNDTWFVFVLYTAVVLSILLEHPGQLLGTVSNFLQTKAKSDVTRTVFISSFIAFGADSTKECDLLRGRLVWPLVTSDLFFTEFPLP